MSKVVIKVSEEVTPSAVLKNNMTEELIPLKGARL